MDITLIAGILIWLWGSYKGWGFISSKNYEWINRKEPLNVERHFKCISDCAVAAN